MSMGDIGHMKVCNKEVVVMGRTKERRLKEKVEGKMEAEQVVVTLQQKAEIVHNGASKSYLAAVHRDNSLGWKPSVSSPTHALIKKYHTLLEDRNRASTSVVAIVVSGDLVLSLQQCIEDVRVNNIPVTPLGRDRVFLHCEGGDDVTKVVIEGSVL